MNDSAALEFTIDKEISRKFRSIDLRPVKKDYGLKHPGCVCLL